MSRMSRKKTSEKRVSDFPDRVKLFETTSRYVAAESEAKGESRAEVIRVLCEEARRARMNESRAKYELSSAGKGNPNFAPILPPALATPV